MKLLAWLVGINIALGWADGFFKLALYQWSPLAFHGYDLFHYLVLPGLCAAWLWARGEISLKDLGLVRDIYPAGAQVALALLLGLGLWAIYTLSEVLLGGIFSKFGFFWKGNFQWEDPLRDSAWRGVLAIYYAATAGFVEEVLFRGCLFRLLVDEAKVAVGRDAARRYVWFSALTFAVAHWEQGSAPMLAAGVFGLCAAGLYVKWRNLWPLIGAHFVVDLISFW